MRDAPSIPLITALQDMGAKVRAYDPVGMEQAKKVLSGRDLLRRRLRLRREARRAGHRHRMGAVPRARPRPAEAGRWRQPVLVDLRNIYLPEEMAQRGFIYESVGRPAIEARVISVVMPRESGASSNRRLELTADRWLLDRPLSRTMTRRCEFSIHTSDRRSAAGADRGAARAQRRGAGRAAGRRQDHARAAGAARRAVGGGQENPGAGAAPAGRARGGRAHGGDARREGRRHRRPARALRLQGVAQDAHRGRHRRHVHAADPRRSRRSTASPRCCSTNSTSARSMPISALALARDAQQGLRDDLKLLVDVGDARRRAGGEAARRRAGDRKRRAAPSRSRRAISAAIRARRSSGRSPTRWRARCAPSPARCWCSCRARRKSAAPRRCCKERIGDPAVDVVDALRRARRADAGPRHRAGAARPAQGRAGDLDRRNLAHHRRRAHRDRLRARARAALRARRRPDAARNRARVARRRRPAPRPRRPHRARRLLSAVGRAADRLARALRAAGNPRRRSVRPAARSGAMGRAPIPARSPFSIRRPRARSPRRGRCSSSLARSTRDGRITDEGRKLRALPLPPRLARMVVDAGARGRGRARRRHRRDPVRARARRRRRRSRHRLDQFRRDRSRRGEDARRMAKRWAERSVVAERARAICRRRDPGARLSRPHRQEPRRRAARSCWPTAAARNVDPASALAREPFLAVAELAGTAAQGRILLAAPITLDEIEQRFADRIESREEIVVRRGLRQPARPPQRAARRARAGRADAARRRRRRERAACWPRASRGSASTGCPGPRRCSNGATG